MDREPGSCRYKSDDGGRVSVVRRIGRLDE